MKSNTENKNGQKKSSQDNNNNNNNNNSEHKKSRSEAGQAGAQARTHESRVEAGKKAAETRKSEDPEAFSKMGEKGGSHSHGGKRSSGEDDKKKE